MERQERAGGKSCSFPLPFVSCLPLCLARRRSSLSKRQNFFISPAASHEAEKLAGCYGRNPPFSLTLANFPCLFVVSRKGLRTFMSLQKKKENLELRKKDMRIRDWQKEVGRAIRGKDLLFRYTRSECRRLSSCSSSSPLLQS